MNIQKFESYIKNFEYAIKKGNFSEFKRLLPFINQSMYYKAALCAIGYRRFDILSELLDNCGVDASQEDNYLIKLAVQIGQLDIVKKILSHPKVDPSANNNEALKWAKHGMVNETYKIIVQELRKDKRVADLEQEEREKYSN